MKNTNTENHEYLIYKGAYISKVVMLSGLADGIESETDREMVKERIRDSVRVFKILLRRSNIPNLDMRVAVQRMIDVLDYIVVSARYGVDSLEVERLLHQRCGRQWLELEDEMHRHRIQTDVSSRVL
ncbi:hypothetical protein [Mesorhizobium sp.]|uniref:hypothetical protein n=1 Tax=Mesorhizobium sp. TaxID=1871066 RepID=UPI000FD52648|nr:hypothetical protein [Mesorhizobium sp.]RVC64479.1 hypothetical protein EN779_01690 [Mesorhizobium sp. M4B.F.Ca.ET.088.02.2.1]RWF28349.1 MAG: hypothetical protein EOS45_22695 [Mesorhizobium sp.]